MGVGRGVGYFTKSRRIAWTFGYTPQRKPSIRLHTMRVGSRVGYFTKAAHGNGLLAPFMGVGRGVGYFTKNIRIRGHVATRHNGRQYSVSV
jgi:hypothetical protein